MPTADEGANAPPNLPLHLKNGFEEEIDGGRYELRDSRGRRIVNRTAQASDYERLRRGQ